MSLQKELSKPGESTSLVSQASKRVRRKEMTVVCLPFEDDFWDVATRNQDLLNHKKPYWMDKSFWNMRIILIIKIYRDVYLIIWDKYVNCARSLSNFHIDCHLHIQILTSYLID